jgi:hypothetical protein
VRHMWNPRYLCGAACRFSDLSGGRLAGCSEASWTRCAAMALRTTAGITIACKTKEEAALGRRRVSEEQVRQTPGNERLIRPTCGTDYCALQAPQAPVRGFPISQFTYYRVSVQTGNCERRQTESVRARLSPAFP